MIHLGMKRVVIIGSSGAGKSTVARAVSLATDIPVVHLDRLFWRSGWKPAPPDETHTRFSQMLDGERWIIEGDFLHGQRGREAARLERADTVVFLDASRLLCLWRVLVRMVNDRKQMRPDLPDGCQEGFDWSLIRWIWSYPSSERPHILRLLDDHAVGTQTHRLRTRADVRSFLERL